MDNNNLILLTVGLIAVAGLMDTAVSTCPVGTALTIQAQDATGKFAKTSITVNA